MRHKFKFISMLVVFLMLAWIVPSTVQAETPSVNDCFEKEGNCEFLEEEGQQEENNQVENQEQENVQTGQQTSENMFLSFLKLILALGLVLALIYFLLKLVNRKNKLFQKHHTLENMGGISLGAQKSMQIVRIGDKFYVVGVGENVELLTEITDKRTIEELVNNGLQADFSPSTYLSTLFGNKESKTDNPDKDQGKENFASYFKKEIDTLKSGRKKTLTQYMHKGESNNE